MTRDEIRLRTGALQELARSLWKRIAGLGQRAPRRLRVSETLSLGERRFVALVEFEQSRFLLGGTASSMTLLADLGREPGMAPQLCRRERREQVEGGQA